MKIAIRTIERYVDRLMDQADKSSKANEATYLKSSFQAFTAKLVASSVLLNEHIPYRPLPKHRSIVNTAIDVPIIPSEGTARAHDLLPPVKPQKQHLGAQDTPTSQPPKPAARIHTRWAKEEEELLIRLREGDDETIEENRFEAFRHHFLGRSSAAMKREYYDLRPKQQDRHWKKLKATHASDDDSVHHEHISETNSNPDSENNANTTTALTPLPPLPAKAAGHVPCPNQNRSCN
ncbi:uncharacterized protein N0V89_011640 [Didymosphaeria variabile]|uniref:Uncharacterized protein n=1 Tax=Didymosphaeria variabile TaxID=1932322 RepID=A0A9W8XC35_9PLEO|nr:uncharacterized protein N0V89_011640 [Didymosphaeria variabile]KAJ4345507.1 hypothetical protein N0V89_011640 [Didymosphaeria variabile]